MPYPCNLLKIVGLSLSTIILAFLSWEPVNIQLLIFVCLVPLLYVATKVQLAIHFRLFTIFLTLFAINFSITFWIAEMSLLGGIAWWLTNSMLFTLPFLGLIKLRKSNRVIGYFLFASSWIICEYIQLNASFGFPFLLLGNGLAGTPSIIQWFSFTGVLGGSLWVLVINILVLALIENWRDKITWTVLVVVLTIPLISNLLIVESRPREFQRSVILHPNINCYSEKFSVPSYELVEEYISVSKEVLDASTNLLVWPETAITDLGWLQEIPRSPILSLLANEFQQYPNLSLVTGAITYEKSSVAGSSTSFSEIDNTFFYTFNSCITLNFQKRQLSIRYKEKLVPFEEYDPYPNLANVISLLFKSVTGIKFTQKENHDDLIEIDGNRIMPIICFEILFGEFIGEKSKNANAYCLLMNEGWYDNLWASRQFLAITQLRAIELGKSFLVSSNRGYSGLVNPSGMEALYSKSSQKSIIVNLPIFRSNTFYSKHGDYIARGSIYLLFALSIFVFAKSILFYFRITTTSN